MTQAAPRNGGPKVTGKAARAKAKETGKEEKEDKAKVTVNLPRAEKDKARAKARTRVFATVSTTLGNDASARIVLLSIPATDAVANIRFSSAPMPRFLPAGRLRVLARNCTLRRQFCTLRRQFLRKVQNLCMTLIYW